MNRQRQAACQAEWECIKDERSQPARTKIVRSDGESGIKNQGFIPLVFCEISSRLL